MSPRRGPDSSFIHGVLVIRPRVAARPTKPPSRSRTTRHHAQAAPSSSAKVGLSLFGWQTHRQALKRPAKKRLRSVVHAVHSLLTPPLLMFLDLQPSAPEFELLDQSAPRFSATIITNACAPPLTPTTLVSTTDSYEPSAPMLTPTFLWTNVQW